KIKETKTVIQITSLPMIKGDESSILRLFQNLIDNSIKYRKDSLHPVIHISSTPNQQGWEFCIADNGIGIDEKYLIDIFKPLHRLHGQENYMGCGLGLAVCKKIIELHNGRIWAESKVNKGTKIIFTIPSIK